MAKKKLIQLLILPFTLIFSLSLVVLIWFLFSSLKSFYLEETKNSLISKSHIFESQVESLMDGTPESSSRLQQVCINVGKSSETRVTVMLPTGVVIADSKYKPSEMDNHNSREEMQTALTGEIGYSIRYSNTLQVTMMYIAVPIIKSGKVIAVLRTSVTTESIDRTLNSLLYKIILMVFLVALLATVTAFVLTRRISHPLEKLKLGAERFARGEFDIKLPLTESEEIAQLAQAMNSMASELDTRFKIITRQKNEQQAILLSMSEAVVAIDRDEKILIMNPAAGELFGVDSIESQGKSLYEVIRNPELQEIVVKTLETGEKYEGELILTLKKEKFISYNTSIFKGSSGKNKGTLLVLNDLTRLKRLENLKQDLVANVSHELRTPITSIKGFVETLTDGAIDNKEDAHRFLGIIDKQVNRLNAIIDDILLLSSIEQNKEKSNLALKNEFVCALVYAAVEICQNKASSKNIDIEITCDEKIQVKLNAPLMEQAVVNLIDNAIKYSPAKSKIIIKAQAHEDYFEISVADQGVGIDKKHIPRLFERFYVVDQARSREMGGTGLGLAIVKHIASAQNGIIDVQSELGQGSTFTLKIPLS